MPSRGKLSTRGMRSERAETSSFGREGPGISTEHFPNNPLGKLSNTERNGPSLCVEKQLCPIPWGFHDSLGYMMHDAPSRNLAIHAVDQKCVPSGLAYWFRVSTEQPWLRTGSTSHTHWHRTISTTQGRTNLRGGRLHEKICPSNTSPAPISSARLPRYPNRSSPKYTKRASSSLPLPDDQPFASSQPFPSHPSHFLTPKRGRSLTSNSLQTAPPTLLQSEMQTLRVVGMEMPEVMRAFSPLSTAVLSCPPELLGFPTPVHPLMKP